MAVWCKIVKIRDDRRRCVAVAKPSVSQEKIGILLQVFFRKFCCTLLQQRNTDEDINLAESVFSSVFVCLFVSSIMQSYSTDVHTIWQKGDGTRATEETINF